MAVKTIADLAGTLRSTFKIGASYTAPVLDWDAAPKKYVDEAISGENLWDRTGTVLTTHTSGDIVSVAKIGVSSTYAVTTPATDFHVATSSESSPRGIMSSQHNDGIDGARIHGRKSRGTLTSPSIVQSGDMLTRWVASGYDGASYLEMASIDMTCIGTIGTNRIPSKIEFKTATNAAPSVLTTAVTIDESQSLTAHFGINIPMGQTYKINGTPITTITYDTSARSHDSDGTQGQRAYNGNYIYECVVTGTGGSGRWVRYTVESDGF